MTNPLSPELSVVIPCFNENHQITQIAHHWHQWLNENLAQVSFELLLINDGSTDGTGHTIDQIRKDLPGTRALHQLRVGPGRALYRGYSECRGKWILQLNANPGYEPMDFMRMWELKEGKDLILGYRTHRLDSLTRRIAEQMIKVGIASRFGAKLHDPNVPFRLMRKDALQPWLEAIGAEKTMLNCLLAASIKRHNPQCVTEIAIPHRPQRKQGDTVMSNMWLAALSLKEIWGTRISLSHEIA